jgi:hypothetical protein
MDGDGMTHPAIRSALALPSTLAALALLAACQGAEKPAPPDAAAATAAASAAAPDTAWRPLFDGATLAGWHHFRKPDAPVAGWSVEDSALVRTGPGGDIVTARRYANFELELEWQVAPGGNSGIMYRVDTSGTETYMTGPEMQVLDDAGHKDGGSPLTSAGSAYAFYAPSAKVVKPAGEWNAVRLVVNGPHVEHWLNGTQVVTYELGSPDWQAKKQASKFADVAGFGAFARGQIALQDHGDRVAYRRIRLRELP